MLFDEMWYEGEICIFFADTNTGKSILAVQIADSISRGVPIDGFKISAEAQPVVYFDFELFDKQFELRYSVDYQQHYRFANNLKRAEIDPDMSIPERYACMEDYLHDSMVDTIMATDARVLIIDNITYLRQETEKAKDALPLMKHLKALKQRYNLSILALAHTPKRDASKPLTMNDLQGSKMLSNFCDSCFCIGASTQDNNLRYLKQIKTRTKEFRYHERNVALCRIEKPHNFLRFSLVGYGNEYEHLKSVEEDERTHKIAEVKRLIDEEGLSQREVADILGISTGTVSKYYNL
jgi:RecA-family ATPase